MVKRIILHWSAGRYYPSEFEKRYYHFLIDVEGNVYSGLFKPEDNDNYLDGKYAAHTGGGNTGSIGVCLCGMFGFQSSSNCGMLVLSASEEARRLSPLPTRLPETSMLLS